MQRRTDRTQYTIRIFNPNDIQPSLQYDLNQLVYESLNIDFPNRNDSEKGALMLRTSKTRVNPNRAVDGTAFNRKQAFARPIGIVALSGGAKPKPVMYITTADNASSKYPWILGSLERQAKLHRDSLLGRDLVSHRNRWLGLCSIHPEIRQAFYDQRAPATSLVAQFMSRALATANPGQQCSTWPASEEFFFREMLTSSGFTPGAETVPTRMFGHLTEPVDLAQYTLAT